MVSIRSFPQVTAASSLLRAFGLAAAATAIVFTFNNYLIFWRGWPEIRDLLAHTGLSGPSSTTLQGDGVFLAVVQILLYVLAVVGPVIYCLLYQQRTLTTEAATLAALSGFITRAAFWAVLLIGVVDMTISFLRVEGFLPDIVGEALAKDLGRSAYRGEYIHYPLMAIAVLISAFTRSLGFTWLALMIVLAEFQIVLARFIFSYEQAFMGDLVRFWYAALFLFASAYTLITEGHVRVDVLYTTFSERAKAWSNVAGSLILGVPLCWIILTSGMWQKTTLINAPLLTYEVSQSGYGMYVKYLMAGFLLIYALSMLIQFVGYALRNAAILMGDKDAVRTEGGTAV